MAVMLYSFHLERRGSAGAGTPARSTGDPGAALRPNLMGPAWVGLLVGWTVYNTILIYWPVQAVQQDVPAALRGLVEFLASLAQAFSALALVSLPRWQHKPGWLAALGGLAVAAVLCSGNGRGSAALRHVHGEHV